MNLTDPQRKELERFARRGDPAYLRRKALLLRNLGQGQTVTQVAKIFHVTRPTVYSWQDRFLEQGMAGLRVRAGRGRKPKAQPAQIEQYLRQSPRRFGVPRTRWSLMTLAQVVPSLKGFSPYGVQKALARAGYRYKRGQPSLHSPDPGYEVKKGLWTKP
jgi:transposase